MCILAARKESGEVNMLKGCTDTPVYQDIEIPTNEDWDAGTLPSVLLHP